MWHLFPWIGHLLMRSTDGSGNLPAWVQGKAITKFAKSVSHMIFKVGISSTFTDPQTHPNIASFIPNRLGQCQSFRLGQGLAKSCGTTHEMMSYHPILEGKQRKALPRVTAFLSHGSFISLFGLEWRRWHSNFHSPNTSSTSSTPQRRILDKRNKKLKYIKMQIKKQMRLLQSLQFKDRRSMYDNAKCMKRKWHKAPGPFAQVQGPRNWIENGRSSVAWMSQINTNHVPMDASWSSTDPVSPCSAGSTIHFTKFYPNLPFEKLWFSLHLELCTCTNDKSYCEMNALKRRATVTMIHIDS